MTIDEIIDAAGGVVKLARIAQLDHSTVSNWRRNGGQVSIGAAKLISAALGIPLHELRPDVWDAPDAAAE